MADLNIQKTNNQVCVQTDRDWVTTAKGGVLSTAGFVLFSTGPVPIKAIGGVMMVAGGGMIGIASPKTVCGTPVEDLQEDNIFFDSSKKPILQVNNNR